MILQAPSGVTSRHDFWQNPGTKKRETWIRKSSIIYKWWHHWDLMAMFFFAVDHQMMGIHLINHGG